MNDEAGLKQELDAQADPKNSRNRNPYGFYWSTMELLMEVGIYDLKYFSGKKVLDFGCGSKLRTSILKDAELYGLDPLLNQFKSIEWSDLNILKGSASVGGEVFYPDFENKFDVVFAINSIDHGPDWQGKIGNIAKYLKQDGKLYLYVDINKQHSGTDKMHHTIDGFELIDQIEKYFEIEFRTTSPGFTKASTKVAIVAKKK